MSHFKTFETERLLLRPTSEKDAELIYLVMNTPKFIRFVGDRKINSIQDAEKYIQAKMLPQLHMLGYSSYSILTKNGGSKIGTCGLYHRDGIDGIDIGFGLLPQYEGMGYAYESAHRLMSAAFFEYELEEIKAITTKENSSSQRLLEKLGLAIIGTTKLPNDHKELLLYQVKKTGYNETNMP